MNNQTVNTTEPIPVAIAWNFVNRGHYMQPCSGCAIIDGMVHGDIWFKASSGEFTQMVTYSPPEICTVDEMVTRLVKRSHLCRIWIYYTDGSRECVWWYEVDN